MPIQSIPFSQASLKTTRNLFLGTGLLFTVITGGAMTNKYLNSQKSKDTFAYTERTDVQNEKQQTGKGVTIPFVVAELSFIVSAVMSKRIEKNEESVAIDKYTNNYRTSVKLEYLMQKRVSHQLQKNDNIYYSLLQKNEDDILEILRKNSEFRKKYRVAMMCRPGYQCLWDEHKNGKGPLARFEKEKNSNV